MDALSETLRVVRLTGAIFINARFTAPWCYQSPHADAAAPLLEATAPAIAVPSLAPPQAAAKDPRVASPAAPPMKRRRDHWGG